MKWFLERLREPSTWRGIVWLATSFGVTLQPEAWEYIIAAGMAIAGLLGIIMKEPSNAQPIPPIELMGRSDAGDSQQLRQSDVPTKLIPEIPSSRIVSVRPPIDRSLGENFSGFGDR